MSALRPAFFILYLESYISRLNEILRHDLTLSVGEPDNTAAKPLIARRAFLSVNSAQTIPSQRIFSVNPRKSA